MRDLWSDDGKEDSKGREKKGDEGKAARKRKFREKWKS